MLKHDYMALKREMDIIMDYNKSLKTEVDNLTKLLLQSNQVINTLHSHREYETESRAQKWWENGYTTKCYSGNQHNSWAYATEGNK